MRPYIGITGFMTQDEVRAAIGIYRDAWADFGGGRTPTHDLMVGVLASGKTLRGVGNKYPLRYPRIELLETVFPSCSVCDGRGVVISVPLNSTIVDDDRSPCQRCSGPGPRFRRLNLVHYASDRAPSDEELFKLHGHAGRYDGVQFNGAWPEPISLVNLHGHTGVRRVVLQIGQAMLQLPVLELRQRIAPYTSVVAPGELDILLDGSGGRGTQVDVELLRSRARLLSAWQPELRIGVAGGLCAETVPALGPLLLEFPALSIDAEGRLRDDQDGGGNLDLDKVAAYLRAAVKLVARAS